MVILLDDKFVPSRGTQDFYGTAGTDIPASMHGASGLLSLRQWPVPGVRPPGEEATFCASYGDALAQDFHLFPRMRPLYHLPRGIARRQEQKSMKTNLEK
jgi:hypothetical protein